MRSTKITIGVACAVTGVLALMLAGWASGAGTSSAAAPVGSGKASATKSVCGLGTGKKASGRPIKLGGIDMLIPGVDFTTIGKVAKAYFDCVNDNGGIRGRPISYTLYNEQLNPAQQASLARKLVESDKVVGIVGNTSFTECGTNWKYYKSKGYTVIGAGVQAECFGVPSIVEVNMGPRYSNEGRSPGPRPRGGQVDRRRVPVDDRGVRGRRRHQGRPGGGHPGQERPRHGARDRREHDRPAAVPGRRPGRRHHPRLHARHGAGAHEGGGGAGPHRQGEVGLLDADREHVHGRAVRQLGRQAVHQLRVRPARRLAGARHPADARDPQEVHEDRPAGVCPDGLHGREVRDAGAPERQGPGHREVVQRWPCAPSRT